MSIHLQAHFRARTVSDEARITFPRRNNQESGDGVHSSRRLSRRWKDPIACGSVASTRGCASIKLVMRGMTMADFISRSNYSGPHRSCSSLTNSLQLEGCFTLGRKLLIHLLDRLLDADGVQIAVQLRLDASWMYRHGAYAITSMTPVESNGEEDIRSLGQ